MTLGIIKANNPCALRPHPGEGWRGSNGAINLPGGAYQSFTSMMWGLRAGLRNLHTYRTKHGLSSPAQIIRRWAPPEDNNLTHVYAQNVAKWVGVGVNEPIPFDYAHTRALLLAITRQETGGEYQEKASDVSAAFALMAKEERAAGRDPSAYVPPVAKAPVDRAIQEAKRVPRRWWAGIGAFVTAAWAQAQDAWDTLTGHLWGAGVDPSDALVWAQGNPKIILAALLIAAFALYVWKRNSLNGEDTNRAGRGDGETVVSNGPVVNVDDGFSTGTDAGRNGDGDALDGPRLDAHASGWRI